MSAQSSSSTKWGLPRALVEPAFPVPGMHLGGFTLLSRAADHPLAERWIARCEHTSMRDDAERHVLLYRITHPTSREGRPAPLDHPHILRADLTTIRSGAGRWCCAPYPGRWEKVFTLAQVMRQRETGGCRPVEAALLAQHLLKASVHAHSANHCHGALTADEILVSPTGAAMIELYALRRALRAEHGYDEERATQEVASIARLASALAPIDAHGRDAKPLDEWAQGIESRTSDGVEAEEALRSLVETMRLPA